MTRADATNLARYTLDSVGLKDWHIRLNTNINTQFLGLCSHQDKTIILSAHHIDIHPAADIYNTVRHEVAHALTPGHRHDEVWREKARELGCDNTQPCSNLSLTPEAIDAIRSGASLEVSYTEEVIRTPTYKISRLQDKCAECGKVAEEMFSFVATDNDGNEAKVITLKCGHVIKRIIPRATPFEKLESSDGKRPYKFQIDGMRFIEMSLASNKGAGIFDEMGLGKTVQVLGYIKFHPEAGPFLYIVKSGIRYQWFKEIVRWLGPKDIVQIISTKRDLLIPGLKHYIISYDLLRRLQKDEIAELKINTVILDECQHIKNPDSTRTQEVRNIVRNAQHVIPLSGTPWKNRGSEFFTVLNMLDPRRFPSYQAFLNRWVEYYWDGANQKEGGIRNPQEFKKHIADIVIRRERTEVMSELPLINRTIYYTEIDDIAQKAYDDTVSEFVQWWNSVVIGGEEDDGETQQAMVAKIAKMRHITGLAKIGATLEFIEEFLQETERKIVIFVHHKDVGEILYRELIDKNFNVPILRLTADMDGVERFNTQEKFNKLSRCIMIASTLASGEGLNLQTCADCIMHERQWNPANEEQAEGRFIRIGQTAKSVNGTYMTAAGTVDELLSGIVERKRTAFHAAMNKGQMPVWNEAGLMKELAQGIVDNFNEKNNKIKKMSRVR